MASQQIVRAKFKLWLEIDTTNSGWKNKPVPFDLSSASLNFGLNSIPSASCTLAAGREAISGLEANIHDHVLDLTETKPARIWLDPTGYFSPTDSKAAWTKAGPQIIFDGYVGGVGYKRTVRSTLPVVMLTHWLSDLAFSSTLSENSHPGNMARFRWRQNPASDNAVRAEGLDEFLVKHVNRGVVTTSNIMGPGADFWAKTLFRIFVDLSSTDVLNKLGPDACLAIQTTNSKIKSGLSRLETATGKEKLGTVDLSGKSGTTGASSPYYVPLALKSGALPLQIANSIFSYLDLLSLDSYFNATAWDKIVGELAPQFYFSVVPRVNTAIVAPFVPGYQTPFKKQINFSDISDWSSSFTSVRPIRGVGVLPGRGSNFAGAGNMIAINTLGGCYAPDANKHGLVFFKRPPLWLEQVPISAQKSELVATRGSAQSIDKPKPSSSLTPRPPQAVDKTNPQNSVEVMNQLGDYYQRVAQYLYATEMLKGRYAVMQGKLRFDLAPGTTVFIKNAPPKFLANDQFGLNLIGSISKVNISLDAESADAHTTLQVDFLRTEAENQSLGTSIPGHPLYEQTFVGAPLIHEYLFEGI